MPAGHLSSTASIFLGDEDGLDDLGLGAGGFSIEGSATSLQVQALARDDVIRQASGIDHSVSISGITERHAQDATFSSLDNAVRQYVWISNVTPDDQDRCLIGPVLTEQVSVETPYQEFVTVTGTMPAAGPWYLCRALAFEVDGVASGSDAITPSGTYTVAYLIIDYWPATAVPTWTFAGSAVALDSEGIQGPEETGDTELEVTAWSGSGTITGWLVTGVEIGI